MSKPLDELTDEERQMALAFRDTFTTINGQIIYDYLEAQYHDEPSFTPGDPYHTAYMEGCRAVFLQIKKNMLIAQQL